MFTAVEFVRRPRASLPAKPVFIIPRNVVTLEPERFPNEQETCTRIGLSTKEDIIVMERPSEVIRKLRGGA